MKEGLIAILSKHATTYQQGAVLNPDKGEYFTVWNVETPDTAKYNNRSNAYIWQFSIVFYSTNADRVNTIYDEVIPDLIEAGWEVDGKGYDMRVDDANYTARGLEVFKYERINTNGNT